MKPRLLDLFCGAGGAAMGYHRAGFEVVGVDVKPQRRYPFEFHQADALEFLAAHGAEYDVIHASPPCQAYSTATFGHPNRERHPDMVGQVLDALARTGRLWIVENVQRAPLGFSVVLCGLMFGLRVFRHRRFASSHLLLAPSHPSHRGKIIGRAGMACVCGHGTPSSRMRRSTPPEAHRVANWKVAMGIDWMSRDELSQAIPPAYTEFLGRQLLTALSRQENERTP